MKYNVCILVVSFVTSAIASFGPLNPTSEPYEREYIWPEGKMPNVQAHQIAAQRYETKAKDFDKNNFLRPYIEWYKPNPEKKIDLCVIAVSGGAFNCCCDKERLRPAVDRFLREGITVVSLTYRTPRPKGLAIYQSGWEDLQRAVRVVRSQAAKRGFNPDKIGATGISAGAKLVLLLATSSNTAAYKPVDEIDTLPCNLLFAIPQAPAYVLDDGALSENSRDGDAIDVKLVPEFKFDDKTCPMCFFQGGADDYSPNGSTQLYRQLRRMKIPAELHLFGGRTHGFHGDMNKGADGAGYDHWFDRALEFIRQMNYDGRLGAEENLMDRFTSDDSRGYYEKQMIWPKDKMPSMQTNQCTPYIEWHIPKRLTTTAIQIIYSGGSYMGNTPDGFEVAPARRYLNEKGMAVVTLKYRTPRPLNGLAKHTTAWQDLQRTIRIVRSQAKSRGLDPDRIGIMGSSAGGHLTLMGATTSRHKSYWKIDELDNLSCKVQWAVAIYPAYALTDGAEKGNTQGGNEDDSRLVPEFAFDLDTCPILFIHGDADGWAAMNSVKCWEQLRRMGIQGDLHTLATRKHCFHRSSAPGTGSYTHLDRIWEFMNAQGVAGKVTTVLPESGVINLEGEYSNHLQDVWFDGDKYIYWAHTRDLVKTDLEGHIIKRVSVEGHHAGIQVRDGKVYVAVCPMQGTTGGKTTPKCRVTIGVYDADTLQMLDMHSTDIQDRSGSLTILDDGTFLVGCLRPQDIELTQVRFHHLDREFKLIKSYVIDNAPVKLGIETLKRKNGFIYLGMYGCDKNGKALDFDTIKLDKDYKEVWRGKLGGSLGSFEDSNGKLWIGKTDTRKFDNEPKKRICTSKLTRTDKTMP